jgi:hypothetical protein
MFGMDQPLFKILNEIRLKEHEMMLKNPIASQNVIVKSGEEVINGNNFLLTNRYLCQE